MGEDSRILDDRQKIISMLTAARIEAGISQQELAERIGTKRSNICRIESGAQNISLDMLLKVSGALGKDVNVILTDRQEPGISNYSLRLYDEELVTFSLEADKLAGLKSHMAILEQIRTIDKKRLSKKLGRLTDSQMEEINQGLLISLGYTRAKPKALEVCLCHRCMGYFYDTSKYIVRRKNPYQEIKGDCTYCNYGKGYDTMKYTNPY